MSSYAITETPVVSDDNSSVPESDSNAFEETITSLKENLRTHQDTINTNKNLPALYRNKNIVTATQLLATKYTMDFTIGNYQKALSELQYVLMGIGSFLFLVFLGWAAVPHTNFTQGGGFVYNTGLIGGILMLVALVYALFKRLSGIRRSLGSNIWYYLHIGCGAVGSYLVILHSSFNLSSINSTVAFITMLFVIISGALGRYLFTLFTILSHKQYAEVREKEPGLFAMIDKYECNTADEIRKRLSKFAVHCFRRPKDTWHYLGRWMSIIYYGIHYYVTSSRDLNRIVNGITILADLNKAEAKALRKNQSRELQRYLFHIVKMGYTALFEQLLKHWRVLHVPSLYLLTITAIAHVVVVHMY